MPGVSEQGQRAGKEPLDGLGDDERGDQDENVTARPPLFPPRFLPCASWSWSTRRVHAYRAP